MEPNGRFVEHVERTDQSRTELIRQCHSLGFSTGESFCLPIERQVSEADALEKAQFRFELPEDIRRDLLFGSAQGQGVHPGCKTLHRSFRRLVNITAGELDEARIRFQAAAMATGAIERRTVAAEKDAHVQLVPLTFEVLKEVINAVKRFGSFPEQVLMIRRQRLEGSLDVNAMFFHRSQHLLLPPGRAGLTPGFDRSLGERLGLIRDHQLRIVSQHIAESFAFGTGAERMVERKENRP